MGTLYDELQRWLKSPVKEKIKQNLAWQKQFQQIPVTNLPMEHRQSKGAEEGHLVAKTVPSAKSTWSEGAQLAHDFGQNTGAFAVPYLTGQYALDTATMAGISVQSLAYRTGHSPFLAPFALRFSPEQAYVDLGRLCPWDQWKVLWTRIGAHYFQECDSESREDEFYLKAGR